MRTANCLAKQLGTPRCLLVTLGLAGCALLSGSLLTFSSQKLPDWIPLVRTVPVRDESSVPCGDGGGGGGCGGVVRILHQSWKSASLPPRFQRWSATFDRCLPGWKHYLWTDEANERLIGEHFDWFLPVYRKLRWPVQRADVARLFYMYRYGGVYCDMDCECLRPFEHLLRNISLAFGAMEGHAIGPQDDRFVAEGQIENSFMYSVPGHPFIMRLINRVLKNPFGDPEQTTGPYMFMREIHRMRNSSAGIPRIFRGMKFLEIFPPRFFNPFSWLLGSVPACKTMGKFSRQDEDQCREAHKNSSFILQYHTQVWQAGMPNLDKD